ncbi:MAG: outer membrane protein assembly factor BamE, partial [Oxalobacter sp.]|nr:outer membrane protein assembly factor BamE [Oxalobacter sp.]
MMVILLAGCGVTTKKTFLGEPVQKTVNNAVPVSSDESRQTASDELSRNPALNSAEATGVQKLLNIITPYRINIQQGNFVSQEMLARIQPGMTKEQVRFALGTPLLTDLFHSARWDYLFRLQKPNGQITNNRVIIYFEDNRVARIVNDPLPEETQYLETIAGPAPKKKVKDSEKKAAADTDKPQESRQTDTPVSDETPSVTDTSEATTEAVEHSSTSPETDRPVPAVTDTQETAPSTTETVITTPGETYRSAPAVTSTPETAPSRIEP